MAPDLHTPLESLLLFQTLHSFEAPDWPPFTKVSESLKSNDLLQESASSARLEPDSLKDLYLRLLKEEVRAEAGQHTQQDGGQSPRKRKRSSPALETVEEARPYTHLMPQLVDRLYFIYRDHAIKSIEDEERKYRTLQREIQEIERGEWDSRLQQQEATSPKRDSRGISSIQNLLRHDNENDRSQIGVRSRPTSSHELQNGSDPGFQKGVPMEPQVNGYSQGSDQKYAQPPGSVEASAPFLPPPQNINHVYSSGSPNAESHRRLPPPHQSQPYTAPLPSPRSTHNQLPPPERSSVSPIILPPPKGMRISSGSPTGPLDALADMAGQQYRASPSMPSPSQFQPPAPPQHPPPQYPPSRSNMQRPHQYYDNQPPFQVSYSPYGQGPLPTYGQQHLGMPAYQGSAASPSHGSPYGNGPHYQSPVPSYSPQPGYGQSPGYYQQPAIQTPYVRGQVQRFAEQHTPLSNASGRQRPPKPSPIFTSASSTRWKNVDTLEPVRQPSPVRPGSREISPVSEKAPSPSPEPQKTRTRGTRNQQNQEASIDSPSVGAKAKSTRGRQTRRGRGGRAGSIASSVAESTRGRSRSHSVTSQADELSIDNRSGLTPKIKAEPSIVSAHEDEVLIASHNADESSRKSIRQRRGTTHGVELTETPRSNMKRKREEPTMLPPPSPSPAPPVSRPGYVLGARNFPRTSATLMNEITAHKVANVFAKPLSERDVPGYKDLIYQPQDLKSIKAAITAGSKSLVAAAEAAGEDPSSSSVWIPESPDVVPPKGIVNSAQLEKELMRMFANAIMYNPDLPTHRGVGPAFRTRARTTRDGTAAPDDEEGDEDEEVVEKGKEDVSVVKDTREMFSAVAPTVSRWRSAERAAEDDGKGLGAAGKLRGGEGGDEEEDGDELAEEVLGSVEEELEVEQEITPEPRAKRRRR